MTYQWKGEMGDTAITWALEVADICLNTNACSPRSEKMRLGIVRAAFDVLVKHYHPEMLWEDFFSVVKKRVEKHIVERFPGRTVDSLFDETYSD